MKKVMLFGTFDTVHKGHLNLFWQARKLGEYLIVVIARDKTVESVKKRLPKNSEKIRLSQMKKCGLADKVVLGSLTDKYAAIKKYRPDIIALGYDQKYLADSLNEKIKEFNFKTKVVRLKPYKKTIYKSSKILK